MKSIRRLALALLALALPAAHAAHQPTYDLAKAPGSAADAADVLAYGALAGDNAGLVVRAGDLNGDGIDDLIVGAPSADVGSPLRVDAGAVHVWFGKGALAGTKDAAGTAGTAPDVTILGASAGDILTHGGALALRDVNGDGTADLILGANGGDGPEEGRSNAGEAYIVFGRKSPATFPATLDLAVPGSTGADVTIYGATVVDSLTNGGALAVGDVNGDGSADLILGAPGADGPAEGRSGAGEAYIVFGRSSPASFPATLDLAVPGSTGADVTILGASAFDSLTSDGVLALGDVNGDGTADLILGANGGDGPAEGRSAAGEAYIVFGRPSPASFPATLDLAVPGSTGADVTLYGGTTGDILTFGGALALGDVNGDGSADLILGTVNADGPEEGRSNAGEAYIVFGRPSPASFPATLDLAEQGSTGADVTLYGATASDSLTSGGALALGDVNGDGSADLILGTASGDGPAEGRSGAGEAYIVFGRSSPASFPATLDLAVPGSTGADVTLYGATAGDFLTVGGALALGDVNGDGSADLILGTASGDGPAEGRSNAGEAYIVFGRPSPASFPATLDLAVPGSTGADVTLYGGTTSDFLTSGGALALGDVNGDGSADLILGAYLADGSAEGRGNAGEAYVLYGIASAVPDIAVAQAGPLTDGGSVAFGTVTLGSSSAAKTFTITNPGTADLTSLAITGGTGEFTVSALSGTTVTPGGPGATFTVTFTPGTSGPRTATLEIASNVTGDKNPYSLVLEGTGNAAPVLTLPPSPVVAGATSAGGAVVTFTVTATDAEDNPDPVPTANPPSGSIFPIGTTTVNVTVTDGAGAAVNASFTVLVRPGALDRTGPLVAITAPATTTVPSTFNLAGTVKDNYGLASFTVKLNGVAQTLDAPLAFTANTNVPWTVTGAAAENGANVVEVTAVDLNGMTTRRTKTVTYTNSRPGLAGTYPALIVPAGTPSNDTTGLITVMVMDTGAFSGTAMLGGTSVPFSGVLRNDGTARFAPSQGTEFPLNHVTRSYRQQKKGRVLTQIITRYLATLALRVDEPAGLSGTLTDAPNGGAPLAAFAGVKAVGVTPAAFLNLPLTGTATRGVYTLSFPTKVQAPPLAANLYPQGDGYASLALTKTGTATLTGYLADGTLYQASGLLRADGTMVLFTPLYGALGCFGGELAFANLADSDVAGSDFLWLRPVQAAAKHHAGGWPTGVRTDAVGTKYAASASLDFGQGAVNTALGNASLDFSDGLLSGPVGFAVSVNPATGAVVKVPANNPNFTLGLTTASGVMSGTFRHTDGRMVSFKGILLNKGSNQGGFGWFLSTGPGGEGGGVTLDPAGP